MSELHKILLAACAAILKPLIRILLRYGIGYPAFVELAKKIYLDTASAEFTISGKKQTTSRISTLTGLSRKEVSKLETMPEPEYETELAAGINRAARVLGGWAKDADFHDEGHPADLPMEGERSFQTLVKRYSGDITARTIADELMRVGALSMTTTGLLRLNTQAYIASQSDKEKIALMGKDVADLIRTIDHNIMHTDKPRLHRKVAYNYIPLEQADAVNAKLTQYAQFCLQEMDKLLAAETAGKSKRKNTSYTRIGVGIFYFEDTQ